MPHHSFFGSEAHPLLTFINVPTGKKIEYTGAGRFFPQAIRRRKLEECTLTI
jgi:hypothetical protein